MQPDYQKIAKAMLSGLIVAMLAIILVSIISPKAKAETIKPVAAQSLDAPYDAKPVWSGIYVGGNAGVVAGVNDLGDGADGYEGGAQVGALFQIGRLVAGIETSYDWAKGTNAGVSVSARKWDISGRLGFLATDYTLLYAKVSRPNFNNSLDNHAIGLGIGGGVETMIAKNWSLALEYERDTYNSMPGARDHIGTVRLNYHLPVLGKLSP